MKIFQRKTIFHTERIAPSLEELKFRFRKRVMLFSFLGFIALMGFPVTKSLIPELFAYLDLNHLTLELLKTRSLAIQSRTPYLMELNSAGTEWSISPRQGLRCEESSYGPHQIWKISRTVWGLERRFEGQWKEAKKICIHPSEGIFIDSTPMGEEEIHLSGTAETSERGRVIFLVSDQGTKFTHIRE